MKNVNNLTLLERESIYRMREQGKSLREIGQYLGRSHSTISKELKRNKSPKRQCFTSSYARALYADNLAKERCSRSKQRQRLKSDELREYVVLHIKDRRSPRDISLRVFSEKGVSLSHEAIYQWIYIERRDLIEFLPRRGKRRSRSNPRKKFIKAAAIKRRGVFIFYGKNLQIFCAPIQPFGLFPLRAGYYHSIFNKIEWCRVYMGDAGLVKVL